MELARTRFHGGMIIPHDNFVAPGQPEARALQALVEILPLLATIETSKVPEQVRKLLETKCLSPPAR
jgi:hypothetical protein